MTQVSVVVPVYNVEKYLKQCLDSLINQTLKDIEIILVDDGSTDQSGKICDEYASKDKRINVIHQKNTGLSGARNNGFLCATSEFLATIDSDDFISTDYLEKLYVFAKEKKLDIACAQIKSYCDGEISDLTNFGNNIFFSSLEDKLRYFKNDIPYFWTSVVNKLFRASLIKNLQKTPNPKNLNIGEDCLMMVKVAFLSDKIGGVHDAFYYYQINPASLTHSCDLNKNKQKDLAMREIVSFMNKQKCSKECFDIVFLNCLYHNLCSQENLQIYLKESIWKNEYRRSRFYPQKVLWYKFLYKLSFGKKRKIRKDLYRDLKERQVLYEMQKTLKEK